MNDPNHQYCFDFPISLTDLSLSSNTARKDANARKDSMDQSVSFETAKKPSRVASNVTTEDNAVLDKRTINSLKNLELNLANSTRPIVFGSIASVQMVSLVSNVNIN